MIDFSDCYIAKVKTFLGLKSIDPFIPFDEFVKKNQKHFKKQIEKKQIIVLDAEGTEVDIIFLEKYMVDYYKKTEPNHLLQKKEVTDVKKNIDTKSNLDLKTRGEQPPKHDPKQIKKSLEQLIIVKAEQKAKIAHRDRLLKSLEESDGPYKKMITEGLERTNRKIEELQETSKYLSTVINNKPKRKK